MSENQKKLSRADIVDIQRPFGDGRIEIISRLRLESSILFNLKQYATNVKIEDHFITRRAIVNKLYGKIREEAMAAFVLSKKMLGKRPGELDEKDFDELEKAFASLLHAGEDLIENQTSPSVGANDEAKS